MADGSASLTNRGVWNDDNVALLRKLHGEGLSCSQIAKRIRGTTRNSIIGKLNRLGIGFDKPSAPPAKARPAPRPAPKPYRPPTATIARAPVADFTPGIEREAEPITAHDAPATAKPWLLRATGECAFPVGSQTGADQLSCCAPTGGEAYCQDHRRIAYQPPKPGRPHDAKALERSLRRFT